MIPMKRDTNKNMELNRTNETICPNCYIVIETIGYCPNCVINKNQ
jgi:predicted amidophosphoribosyltransferase